MPELTNTIPSITAPTTFLSNTPTFSTAATVTTTANETVATATEVFSTRPTSLANNTTSIAGAVSTGNITVGTGTAAQTTTGLLSNTTATLSTSGINTLSAPNLSLNQISPTVNINGPINVSNLSNVSVSSIASNAGIPTSIGAAASTVASRLNIATALPSTGAALRTLGLTPTLSNLGITFPKFPEFPGLDLPAVLIGKSPKFIAEYVVKFKTIVLPFIPGVKLNMATALAAASILRTIASGNGKEIIKHLVSGLVNDIANETLKGLQKSIDSTGIKNVGTQFNQAMAQAKNDAEQNFKRTNPPIKTTDPDTGETTEEEQEMPEMDFPDLNGIGEIDPEEESRLQAELEEQARLEMEQNRADAEAEGIEPSESSALSVPSVGTTEINNAQPTEQTTPQPTPTNPTG
jgi:hypothetical protein